MIYIRQEIAGFTYSNIVSTVPEYNPATNYILGDMVRVGNYEYKSLYGTVALPNIGKDPLSNLGTSWFEYGSSNMYACLDSYPETKTVWEGDGVCEFLRGQKDTLGIGAFDATKITIEYRDSLDNILENEEILFSNSVGVYDEWTYGYAEFTSNTINTLYLPLKLIGKKIRVIFQNDGKSTSCGFLTAGRAVYVGDTIEGVNFPDKRTGNRTVPTADFSTIIDNNLLMIKINEAKKLINETMLFIIDESENSQHSNMVFLGTITKVDGAADNFEKNKISWQIEQTILQ